jgi:hypothetical protein
MCSVRKSEQRPHMRGAGFGEGGEAVAAFERRHHAAFGVALGDRDDLLDESGVVGGFVRL